MTCRPIQTLSVSLIIACSHVPIALGQPEAQTTSSTVNAPSASAAAAPTAESAPKQRFPATAPAPTAGALTPNQQPVIQSAADTDRGKDLRGSQLPPWPIQILAIGIWPSTIMLAFFLFKTEIRAMLRRTSHSLSRIKAAGVEVEFSEESARSVRESFDSSYKEFLEGARREYDRQAKIHGLRNKLEDAVRAVRTACVNGCEISSSCRATVHVPDVVFSRYIYQLLDYSPRGKGRGRRFSERFGIVGRSWRLSRSLGEGNALAPTMIGNDPVDSLITGWGMTRVEAEGSREKRRSFLCILLKVGPASSRESVGVLYVDDETLNAFGDNASATAHAVALESDPAVGSLALGVAAVMSKLGEGGAFLELEEST